MWIRILLCSGKLPQWNCDVNGTIFERGLRSQGWPWWNCNLNGTTFQSGLRFQTDLISLRVSRKRALNEEIKAQRIGDAINEIDISRSWKNFMQTSVFQSAFRNSGSLQLYWLWTVKYFPLLGFLTVFVRNPCQISFLTLWKFKRII